jgi:hypothetical protein
VEREGPYNPLFWAVHGICSIYRVTVTRFFCAETARLDRPIQMGRQLLHIPCDAQALANKRANRRHLPSTHPPN